MGNIATFSEDATLAKKTAKGIATVHLAFIGMWNQSLIQERRSGMLFLNSD